MNSGGDSFPKKNSIKSTFPSPCAPLPSHSYQSSSPSIYIKKKDLPLSRHYSFLSSILQLLAYAPRLQQNSVRATAYGMQSWQGSLSMCCSWQQYIFFLPLPGC